MYIYGLVDPRDKQIRYIGKAIDPKDRLWKHLTEARTGRYKKCQWLKGLLKTDMRPELVILEETSEEHRADDEQAEIGYWTMLGARLTNMTRGGDGVRATPDVRAKISAAQKGKPRKKYGPQTVERRAKISQAHLKAGIRPPSRKGAKMSVESRAKMSAKKHKKPIIVYRVTGECVGVYPTMRAACTELNLDRGNARRVINGTNSQTGGYTLRFAA